MSSRYSSAVIMAAWCFGICGSQAARSECVAYCDSSDKEQVCHTEKHGPTLDDVASQCTATCIDGYLSQESPDCFPGTASTDLIRTVGFRGGCVAVFEHGIYFSPDCKDLRGVGAGKTVKIYHGDYENIRGMSYYHNCIITAFKDGTIHKSCGEKLDLAGDKAVFTGGVLVYAMYTHANEVCVSFVNNECYCDPNGDDFTGGHPGDHRC